MSESGLAAKSVNRWIHGYAVGNTFNCLDPEQANPETGIYELNTNFMDAC